MITPRASMRVLFLILTIVFSSCNQFGQQPDEPIAVVHGKHLYKSDIPSIFPENINDADSIQILKNYIDKWIKNQLMVELAELNLPEEEKNFDKQIADFRASLLIHRYQQYMLSEKLDTIISIADMELYYNNNTNNFILERPAIRGVFIKVPLDAPNKDYIVNWFREGEENGNHQLDNYAVGNAVIYENFFEDWAYIDLIINQFPRDSRSDFNNIENIDHVTATDSEYFYFAGIREHLSNGNIIPFPLAIEKIKTIIINKRKIEFLRELERDVFTEAVSKNAFQYL